jgi:hypothetical protein
VERTEGREEDRVRQGRAVAIAAVTLVGLTGCADRPNNLETYYDDPPSSSTPQPAPSSSPSARAETSAPTKPASAPLALAVNTASLTPADLAAEGVRPAPVAGRFTGCLLTAAPGTRTTTWTYPSGSALSQQVTAYPDRRAADVLATLRCAGKPFPMPVPPGVDVARAWTDGGTCTVLLAKGHVLSGLQVVSNNGARAADAAKRLAPIAAGKLRGVRA